ncbi:hypothetical protein LBMAG33_3650 [Candidatus Levyibacteriota bacterium]|nr:cupredoxin domain-containing protein [Candidatus Levybacteria bacterium]MSU26005.1 hypothetical protein [Candidatus Levybacteria bacterium]GDX62055.1 hypothetical protein LBMAG33_3650 [Candidatus Levybacteria bacterium]
MDTKKNNAKYIVLVVILIIFIISMVMFLIYNNGVRDRKVQSEIISSTSAGIIEKSPLSEDNSVSNTEATIKEKISVKSFIVIGKNFSFSPKEIKVNKDDNVEIIFNNEEGVHDFVIDEFNARTESLSAGKNQKITFVADKIGKFEFYCSIGNHRKIGMVGNLIVK